MAQDSKKTRLYSEEEMGKLIQRATELQQSNHDTLDHGLSLPEIERIAAEMGLDPAHLRHAALELDYTPDTDESKGFWGTPFQIDLKRVTQGTLSDEQWENIVLQLRSITGNNGNLSEMGNTKEWSHFIDEVLGYTRVSISPKDDLSTIKVHKQYRGIGIFTYLLAFLIGGAAILALSEASGIIVSVPVGLTLLGAGCTATLLAARAGLHKWTKRQRRKLEHMMDKVVGSFSASHQQLTEKEPLLDLQELHEEVASQAPARIANKTKT